jgi:hypothetical protein
MDGNRMSIVRHALFLLAVGLFLQANALVLKAGNDATGDSGAVEAVSTILDDCPVCFFLGFDCEGPVDCSGMGDPQCSDLCRDFGSECQHEEWDHGYLAACDDSTGFSCACVPGGR